MIGVGSYRNPTEGNHQWIDYPLVGTIMTKTWLTTKYIYDDDYGDWAFSLAENLWVQIHSYYRNLPYLRVR